MQYGIGYDVGIKRKLNEDYYGFIIHEEDSFAFFALADGLGGHKAGDVASKEAVVEALKLVEDFYTTKKFYAATEDDLYDLYNDIFFKVNKKVYDISVADISCKGMGTTLDLCLIMGEKIMIGHIGDSRCYTFKDDVLNRITKDHSYVEELVSQGKITEEEARVHPNKNMITKAIGMDSYITPDIIIMEIDKSRQFLMCSDGLTNMLCDTEIADILKTNATLQEKCDILVNSANKNGGLDNISIIIFER